MALLAESLVDEWLNRRGFFTIRGIKAGHGEIDLLGIRPVADGLVGWHVEVQASFRPVGYLTDLTKELAERLKKASGSAAHRTPDILRECVEHWVANKFTGQEKYRAREAACAEPVDWKFVFVHAVVREKAELDLIRAHGVELVPFHQIIAELLKPRPRLRGAAGTDLAEIIAHYQEQTLTEFIRGPRGGT